MAAEALSDKKLLSEATLRHVGFLPQSAREFKNSGTTWPLSGSYTRYETDHASL
jgi:hypothetical protein